MKRRHPQISDLVHLHRDMSPFPWEVEGTAGMESPKTPDLPAQVVQPTTPLELHGGAEGGEMVDFAEVPEVESWNKSNTWLVSSYFCWKCFGSGGQLEDEELFELDEELGEEPNEGSPPELSPEELEVVDAQAGIEEIERLLFMAVLKDPTPDELQQGTLLSTRSVYDWRWREMRWKRRCRFVAREFKGYSKGTSETFAPTAGVGARLVLLMHVVYKWMLQFVDVKDAFLLVPQKTCVLVTVPDWWRPENAHQERFWALHRSLPGQRNAASRWYDFLHDNLVDLQFETIPILPSVFRHQTRNLVLCTHVDDLILAGTQSDLEWCTEELKKKLTISDSGLIPRLHQSPREAVRFLKKRHFFVDEGLVTCPHEKYIPHLIDLYQVRGRKPKVTPEVTRDCLDGPELSDMGKKRS